AQLDPARLAWGLAALAERLGVTIHEHSPATAIEEDGDAVVIRTPLGSVRAAHQGDPSVRVAGVRPRVDDRTAVRRADGFDRVVEPAGPGRHGQPVPLLPADRRRPDLVGRLRRDLPLEQRRRSAVRAARRHVLDALEAVLRDVPAARGLRFTHAWAGA